MFSGIIEETGKVLAVTDTSEGRRLRIAARLVTQDLKTGDSVSISGACHTVTENTKEWFQVESTLQTLRLTRLGSYQAGQAVNLERAMRLSDRLGGHLVSGHVDGVGVVESIILDGFSKLVTFSVGSSWAPWFVEKGSVAVDGVSLTVAKLQPAASPSAQFAFTVALIPKTMMVTTLGALALGALVNIEVDMVGKYVARWLEVASDEKGNKAGLSLSFLAEHGYTER